MLRATVGASRQAMRHLWRATILTHRYVGIALGLLVLVWCVSGVVMMYVPYPSLDAEERLAGLVPIDRAGCCTAPSGADAFTAITGHALEMLDGVPVLRVTQANGVPAVFDLRRGRWLQLPGRDLVVRVGRDFGARQGFPEPRFVEIVQRDQWTVNPRFNLHRPLWRFADGIGREWYVSGRTAEVVQLTHPGERLWNWIGAVAHWLYPTMLRQHPAAWSQTVIWLTVAALFLTVTGLLIGICQLRGARPGRLSPYRGWTLWHHYSGLLFGLLTLAWLFSGLLSMNPWGWLEGRSFDRELAILGGGSESLGDVTSRLGRMAGKLPPGTVRVTRANWLGQPFHIAWDAEGERMRLNTAGLPAPSVTLDEVRGAAADLRPREQGAVVDRLSAADAYYYSHHHEVREFPVLRIRYPDGERFYVSETTGGLALAVDASRRAGRWLFAALHRGDFHAVVRWRPLWDLAMLLALAGATAGVASGTYLGLKRLVRVVVRDRDVDGRLSG